MFNLFKDDIFKNKQIKYVIRRSVELLNNVILEHEKYSFHLDCNLFAMAVLNYSKVELIINSNNYFNDITLLAYYNLLIQRVELKPVAYILGKCEFMSLNFIVNENVLIPRADTEILVEESLKYITDNNVKRILEIGTGSGCISISIAKYCEFKDLEIIAVDISPKALDIASKNAILNNVNENINFCESNLFSGIDSDATFDLIISNPPYINSDICGELDKSVKDYEPLLALDGGSDGLDFYRSIIFDCDKYLNKKSAIFFEIGYDQSARVITLLNKFGYKNAACKKDLAGNDRVVFGYNY